MATTGLSSASGSQGQASWNRARDTARSHALPVPIQVLTTLGWTVPVYSEPSHTAEQ